MVVNAFELHLGFAPQIHIWYASGEGRVYFGFESADFRRVSNVFTPTPTVVSTVNYSNPSPAESA